MQNPAKNIVLLLVVAFVAGVVVQSAKRLNGPSVPTTAIEGERNGSAGSVASNNKTKQLSPTVIQPTVESQERAAVSPVRATGRPMYGGNPSVTPQSDPTSMPAINGGLTTGPASESPAVFDGAFPVSRTDEPNPSVVETPAEPELPQKASRIVTGPADSFWSISKRVYGSEVYYRALFRHNRREVLRPDQLQEGTELEIPTLDTLRSKYPDDIPADADGA